MHIESSPLNPVTVPSSLTVLLVQIQLRYQLLHGPSVESKVLEM